MKILFLGDICGRVGRTIVKQRVPGLRKEIGADFVIANGENASGGIGLKPEQAKELLASGIDVLTGGNHTFKHKDIYAVLQNDPRVLRPANFPKKGVPGFGYGVYETPAGKVAVINLIGRTFMEFDLESPFERADELIDAVKLETKVIFVDFHAEATAEKIALGLYLDGRASAVVGTHTHVATADERILDEGCAYLTDAGMCGAHAGIIGMEAEGALARFLTSMPQTFKPAKDKPYINGVIVEISGETGKAVSVERLSERC